MGAKGVPLELCCVLTVVSDANVPEVGIDSEDGDTEETMTGTEPGPDGEVGVAVIRDEDVRCIVIVDVTVFPLSVTRCALVLDGLGTCAGGKDGIGLLCD